MFTIMFTMYEAQELLQVEGYRVIAKDRLCRYVEKNLIIEQVMTVIIGETILLIVPQSSGYSGNYISPMKVVHCNVCGGFCPSMLELVDLRNVPCLNTFHENYDSSEMFTRFHQREKRL